MLSKNVLKLIKSLYQKKYRIKNNLFIVEGVKGVNEFLNSNFTLYKLFCIDEFEHTLSSEKIEIISVTELHKISKLNTPNEVLALFEISVPGKLQYDAFTIVLDGVNDPGNLGTIIRLCDWFGVRQLVCSKDTVDCFNPKVVQSTMGSLTRVSIIYTDLVSFIKKASLPVYSTMMSGENVYTSSLPEKAVVVLGNEANGVSSPVNTFIKNRLTIPKFGVAQMTESLNVASATAILLSEFKRS